MTDENYLLADSESGEDTGGVDVDPREADPGAYSASGPSRPFKKKRDSRRERHRQWDRLGF